MKFLPKEPVVCLGLLAGPLRRYGEVDGRLGGRPGEVEGAAAEQLLDLHHLLLVGVVAAHGHHGHVCQAVDLGGAQLAHGVAARDQDQEVSDALACRKVFREFLWC